MRLRLLPLFVLVAVMALSFKIDALRREFWGSAVAEAQEQDTKADRAMAAADSGAVEMSAAGMAPEVAAEPGETDTQTDPFSLTDEEIELLQKLAERREEIEREVEVLERRKIVMQAAEGRVDRKLEELKILQVTIEGLLVQHDEQEEAQLQSLVKIYESMKPKDAARIFEQLDMVVLLDVIGRMKERKSAPILAVMDPERAKEVTLELASRRSLPMPRE